ncbi:MAG: nucleotidyltransferase [Clostridia bacterium]|nr:nucleotidyltransferase [Clostridia bacterium]
MNDPILLIMAAGMGSRYGGLKQMDSLGPDGEVILHYSIFDARRAGFRRVVFLIKHEIEADFRRLVGQRVEPYMQVSYAFQELSSIPKGFTLPTERTKPLGTAHAVLCAAEYLDAPFAVINADDYYGPSSFESAYAYLSQATDDEKARWMMVGYDLSNTTTPNGYVARGVCQIKDGYLESVQERTHIIESCDGPLYTEDGIHYTLLSRDTKVSMNMWGFTPSILGIMKERFPVFLSEALPANPLKAEFFLPSVVSYALSCQMATVSVLSSHDKWYGVTYHEDREGVIAALRAKTEEGLYPPSLFPFK